MKYKICEWEDNGYHDSYFYGAYYDTDTGKIVTCSLGATAYYGGHDPLWQECLSPTAEIAEATRLLLADFIFATIRAAEHCDVLTPSDARKGDVMRLTAPHHRQLKDQCECYRCFGKGYWQNPRVATDRRECFTCKGTCKVAAGEKLRDAKGRLITETIPAGATITVLMVKAYGNFYRNGYNRPGRDNRTVTGTLENGTIVSVPLKKLRMSHEPMSDAELRERAETLSHHHEYGRMTGCRAWLSHNYCKAAADNAARQTAA